MWKLDESETYKEWQTIHGPTANYVLYILFIINVKLKRIIAVIRIMWLIRTIQAIWAHRIGRWILTFVLFLIFYLFLRIISGGNPTPPCTPSAGSGEKFITTSFTYLCGGLGNQMWRFASLYAIGKQIGRTPYFDVSVRCMLRAVQEAEDTFPEYARLLRFERRGETGRVLVDFAKHCCKFDDLGKLKGIEDDYIQLSADHLQSYHYFENMNDEIRRIFAFSQEVKKITGDYAKRLFGDDESSHKLCVYTRRGDFIQYNTHSKLNFTEKAMEYATRVLKGKFGDVSVVLLGEDKPFLKNVTYNKKMTHAVHIPKSMSRGEDLCFAVTQCNSLLLTVPASTFGWWIGYLMNIQQATPTKDASGYVFYNSNFFLEDSFHGYRNYFPEWIPLRLLPSNAIVEM